MRLGALASLAVGAGLVAMPHAARADGAEGDAHALFAEGRFTAAAASFEKQFADTANLSEGMNAVVAWRAAGRYAHARVLLQTIAAKHPAGPLANRAQLLEARLAVLTGTLTFDGVDRPVIVKVDGAPAERLGDEVIVDVGARDVSVEAEGCEPARSHHVLRPTEHVQVTVKLVCKAYPGNLHVELAGARRATVYVDGLEHAIAESDLDVPLPTGTHHLVVQRRGIAIADEDVAIAPSETARRKVDVPWRAMGLGFTAALTTVGYATSDSQASLVGALQLGAVFGLGDTVAMLPTLELGYAANHVTAVPDSPFAAVGLVFRIFRPVIQHRSGSTLLTLDLDPLSFRGAFAIAGSGASSTSIAYYSVGVATLTLEVPHVHLEAQVWPAGVAVNSTGFADLGTHFATEVAVTAGWAFEP